MDEKTEKAIKAHYEKGQGSIQDIARVYRVTVEEVLHLIGQDDLTHVQSTGDLVDPSEAGPGADINYNGATHYAQYSTN